MRLPCPCCKAETEAHQPCRRCKADLTELSRVAERADYHLAVARNALAGGRVAEGVAEAERSLALRLTAEGARVRSLAAYMARDFSACHRWHQAWGRLCARSS